MARQARPGVARLGRVRVGGSGLGMAVKARRGTAWLGKVWRGMAGEGFAMKQSIRKRGAARGKLGHAAPHHFTGKKGGKKIKRKGKRRRRGQAKHGAHVNKYEGEALRKGE